MQIDAFEIQGNFPAFISPKNPNITYDEFIQILKTYQSEIHKFLLNKGALLFRGFPINKPAEFAHVVESIGLGKFVNYIGGDSPRDKVEAKVYTSTEAPPYFRIPLHQELSFIKNFPKNIYFFCEIEPVVGGETIIADAKQIYKAVNPDVLERFQGKGLTYTSRYYYQSKIMELLNQYQRSHKSWPEVFETKKKDELEQKCHENEFGYKWLRNDWVEIKQTRPAVMLHPQTKDKVWFNQAHLYDFNPKLLGWKNYISSKILYFRKSTLLHEIEFADGSNVPRQDLYHIYDILNENTVAFPWRKGDVMVLDNILAMHGRAPFKGKRRILTAMTS